MNKKGIGERVSFIWLALATIAVIMGAFLVSDTLQEKALDDIFVVIEDFEKTTVKAKQTNGGEHFEELEVGVVLNEEDLDILARIIHGESGSNWCSDTMQMYVGSVFLNRVAREDFPNTYSEVAFQKGQYTCTKEGSGYWQTPTERDVAMAKFLMINGSQLDKAYVWQGNSKNGRDVIKVQNMYFGKK